MIRLPCSRSQLDVQRDESERGNALCMLNVSRLTNWSRPSSLVILFLPKKSDLRLVDAGRFSIDWIARVSSAWQVAPQRKGATHSQAVAAELEVLQLQAVSDAFYPTELVLDQVQVREVWVSMRRLGRLVLERLDRLEQIERQVQLPVPVC